jgi:hypothetical protein
VPWAQDYVVFRDTVVAGDVGGFLRALSALTVRLVADGNYLLYEKLQFLVYRRWVGVRGDACARRLCALRGARCRAHAMRHRQAREAVGGRASHTNTRKHAHAPNTPPPPRTHTHTHTHAHTHTPHTHTTQAGKARA